MNYKVLLAAFLAASVVSADSGFEPAPRGWGAMGGMTADGSNCDMGVDGDLLAAGQPNLSVRCRSETHAHVGLRQTFDAAPYWGKRIRFSGWFKADGITAEAGGAGSGLLVQYGARDAALIDFMLDDAVTGWTDWEYRELVTDVPRDGQWFTIGFWLRGQGQVWVRDLQFEEVSDSVATNVSPITINDTGVLE